MVLLGNEGLVVVVGVDANDIWGFEMAKECAERMTVGWGNDTLTHAPPTKKERLYSHLPKKFIQIGWTCDKLLMNPILNSWLKFDSFSSKETILAQFNRRGNWKETYLKRKNWDLGS
ncbi:hypothetical protein Pfo_013777 [Paulownia fortunei]|nr:hypothetical protein Pfo_013777 [Paulownia fortunei]